MKKQIVSMAAVLALGLSLLAGCATPAALGSSTPAQSGPAPTSAGGASAPGALAVATTEEVQAALEDANAVVVDARLNDAYNGWALDGVARGGHIPGATDLSALSIAAEQEDSALIMARTLENKGLTGGKRVIVYDAGGGEAQAVAAYLAAAGVADISLYNVNTWVDDASLGLEAYPNYELIVPASVVNDLIEGKTVDTFDADRPVKVVEVSWGAVEESGYLDGHIPTAFHINTDSFEPPTETDPPEWRLGSDAVLLDLVLQNGIVAGDCVITTSAQPMAAYRFATILHYLGVEDVRVMNGGMNEWSAAGYKLATDEVVPTPATDFGMDVPANPDVIDTIAETQALLGTQSYQLLDNRTWGEYIGQDTGYSYHSIAGRIKGAIYAYSGEDGNSNSMTYYRNPDWTMRNGYEILAMWEEAGVDLDAHLATMCGGGWRAAETYWFARVMGLDASLFSDGWCAWSNDGLPLVTGEPGAPEADASAVSAAVV